VTIDWIRGRKPVFQLVTKDTKTVLKTFELDKLTIPEINQLLIEQGFPPRRPVTDVTLRMVTGDDKAMKRYPEAVRFVNDFLPAHSGYIRHADKQSFEVLRGAKEMPHLDVVNKANGTVTHEVPFAGLTIPVVEGVLAMFDFVPVDSRR